jgi:hypothetical protein
MSDAPLTTEAWDDPRRQENAMKSQPSPDDGRRTTVRDVGTPTLLLVAQVGVLGGVVGVLLVGASETTWSLLVAMVIVLVGLVAVAATMTRQLGEAENDRDPDAPRSS